jgi:hypothetical protein
VHPLSDRISLIFNHTVTSSPFLFHQKEEKPPVVIPEKEGKKKKELRTSIEMLSKFMNGITIITQFLYTHFTEKEKGEKREEKSLERWESSASSGKAHHSFEYTVESD